VSQSETLRESLDKGFDLGAQRANFVSCDAEFAAQLDETSCHALVDLGLTQSVFADGPGELIDRGLAVGRRYVADLRCRRRGAPHSSDAGVLLPGMPSISGAAQDEFDLSSIGAAGDWRVR
jgi:hypothetical protein